MLGTPIELTADLALHSRLDDALQHGDEAALAALADAVERTPLDERSALLLLTRIHALWLAPVATSGGVERFQQHPAIAAMKWRLERRMLRALDETVLDRVDDGAAPETVVAALRRIAARDLVPDVYAWLQHEAGWEQLVDFITLEGGPDGGFDDLVAIAQVGIDGVPKLALARNYWDEMGAGDLDGVHTALHRRLVAALHLEPRKPEQLPTAALARGVLHGTLATTRARQPEMIGALGLVELQAGPRSRAVARALRRLGAPADALPFYEEHAVADPRHGKEWLDEVVVPLVESRPGWAAGLVRGAAWRSVVNRRFYADVHARLADRATGASEDAGAAPVRPRAARVA